MDFSMIQSIGTYTKNMGMQMKWQKKKEDNDFTADGSTKWSDPTARQAEEIRRSQADGSAKLLSQIRTKLAAGKKLTQEEMDYLQKNDLPTYQKVKAIEAEQKSYEKELKNCKTKEDVQRVRTNRVAASLSVVNNVKNNPAIPEGAKLGLIWQELQKNMVMEETIKKFVESGEYAQLPTEAEKLEAEKELKEWKEAELGIKDTEENAGEKEPAENVTEAESTVEEASADKAPVDKAPVDKAPVDKAKEIAIQEALKRDRTFLQERKKTRAEVEATPEARKVKRAKAQAAYKRNSAKISGFIVDMKAE
ncbi:MAG: hypothetical protein HFI28_00895 [Lachnospiraceae bacterium]|nr:hypothetical protein [Lachnospiraceae bacterium]